MRRLKGGEAGVVPVFSPGVSPQPLPEAEEPASSIRQTATVIGFHFPIAFNYFVMPICNDPPITEPLQNVYLLHCYTLKAPTGIFHFVGFLMISISSTIHSPIIMFVFPFTTCEEGISIYAKIKILVCALLHIVEI